MKCLKIILGTKCNLHCDYCYQKHDDNTISKEVLDAIVDNINSSNEKYVIHLFGGEPLLYLDQIFYLLDRIDISKHSFSISTNAVLKDNFRKLEEKLGIEVANLLSNKSNKDYFKLNSKSNFRYVTTKSNLDELKSNLDYFLQEYKDKFSIFCNFYEKWDIEHLKRIEEIEKRARTVVPNITVLKPVIQDKITCGCKNIIVNYNGDLLACHRDQKKIIGNILKDGFVISNNAECIFKEEILNNFISQEIESNRMSVCEYDIVFYC